MRSQKLAPLPQNRPRRTAISGETAERTARMECSICRETPSWRAASVTVRLSAGSTSSRRSAPGWTGAILGGCLAEYSDCRLLSGTGQNRRAGRRRLPNKGDTPWAVDRGSGGQPRIGTALSIEEKQTLMEILEKAGAA